MRPTGPRSHGMRPAQGNPVQIPASGFRVRLRGPRKALSKLRRVETEVIVGQWLTALLVVVVMLQHDTRFSPFPEGAPAESADFAGDPDQLQCPRRMGLVDNISRNRRLANGYRHTSDLGHCMKGNQEAEKK